MAVELLLVDDTASLLLTYSIILSQNGYAVTTAQTYDEALELVRSSRFDILLCDVALDRGHSGLDIVRHALKNHSGIQVGLITGSNSIEAFSFAEQVGATVFLKPVPVMEVLSELRHMANRVASPRRSRSFDKAGPQVLANPA